MTMKTSAQSESPNEIVNDRLDALCREFNGDSFYGLEYALEDVFQGMTAMPVPACPAVDWFGLCG
jgi:hypothetical protein